MFFIMFHLGLEFNLRKIRKVIGVSLIGSSLLLFLTVGLCLIIGLRNGRPMAESIAIGSCVFLSSTAVVLNFLDEKDGDLVYGRSIMGVLVAQDLLLGFLLIIMPALQTSSASMVSKLAEMFYSLVMFLGACLILRYPWQRLLSWLSGDQKRKEIFLIGSVAFCISIVRLGVYFGQSNELACFIAGAMIANHKKLSESVMQSTIPIKHMFSALFFASLGLHIYPSFLRDEAVVLLILTSVAMVFKIFLTTLVMLIAFRHSFRSACLVGIGLGQISEFTFVQRFDADISFDSQKCWHHWP